MGYYTVKSLFLPHCLGVIHISGAFVYILYGIDKPFGLIVIKRKFRGNCVCTALSRGGFVVAVFFPVRERQEGRENVKLTHVRIVLRRRNIGTQLLHLSL